MATTKKYLDEDGLVQYTSKVKKAINDASYTHGVTDIEGTPAASAPTIASTVNATNNARSGNFTANGSADTFTYYDTTYGDASTSKAGLMSSADKTKLNGIATGAEVNVQSDWNQSTTTADDFIKNKPAVNKVKQTQEAGTTALPILMSHNATPTSESDYEAGYDSSLTFKPSTNELIIGGSGKLTVTDDNGLTTTISPAGITLPGTAAPIIQTSSEPTTSATQKVTITVGGQTSTPLTISPAESGKYGVVKVDTALSTTSTNPVTNAAVTNSLNAKANSGDLNNVSSGQEGARLIGYAMDSDMEDITVKDALDDIYAQIGSGGGGNSLTSRVTALEGDVEDLQEGSNLVEGSNITITPDTTNHTVTIAAADEKVKQSPTTQEKSFRLLLTGDEYTSATTAGANFSTSLKFNPNNKKMYLDSSYSTGSGGQAGVTYKTEIVVGGEGVQIIKKDSLGATLATGTLSATDYSGTAAKATADGSGNNIVNTYATKAALDALSNKWTGQFKIATSAEATAIAAGNASSLELGYIYLVEDSTASSPNVYDEYIKVALGTSPETYSVEKIGTTDAGVDVVSLTPAEINTIWSTTAAAS